MYISVYIPIIPYLSLILNSFSAGAIDINHQHHQLLAAPWGKTRTNRSAKSCGWSWYLWLLLRWWVAARGDAQTPGRQIEVGIVLVGRILVLQAKRKETIKSQEVPSKNSPCPRSIICEMLPTSEKPDWNKVGPGVLLPFPFLRSHNVQAAAKLNT